MIRSAFILMVSLVGLKNVAESATIDLATGLVGEYLFNGNTTDSSGNSNNGTANNVTLTSDRFGNSSAAYNFSGNYSYISVSTLLPNIGAGATIFAWFKADPAQLSGQQNIISQPRGNLPYANQLVGLRLQLFPNQVNAGYNDSTQNAVAFGPNNSAVGDGGWHSVAATLFTDSTSRTLSVYFDGIFSESVSLSPLNVTSDVPFYIGTQFDPSTTNNENPFIGSIDDVRVYSRALNSAEVQALHVPEPSLFSLLLAGGAVLLGMRNTRKTKI